MKNNLVGAFRIVATVLGALVKYFLGPVTCIVSLHFGLILLKFCLSKMLYFDNGCAVW